MTLARIAPPGRALLGAALLAVLLAGCAAPARLARPALRDDVPLAGLPTSARAGWPAADWWRGYGDPQLDELIARATRQSPDLAQARARVRNAEQSVRLAATQAGLRVNGNAQWTRQRMSENGILSLIPPPFGGQIDPWYNQADLGLQVSYDFDWWGKTRSAMEAALDQAHAAEAEHAQAALTLQNAVADAYFGWQGDQARLALARQSLGVQQQLERLAALRVKQGVDLPDTVQQARGNLAAVREQIAALEGSAELRKAALAALLGVSPAELPALRPRPLPEVAGGVPADVRLDLVARRPDVAASRWMVESALNQTDVARAQFFPDLSISALAGLSSLETDNLLKRRSETFSLSPALHLPIFEGGMLKANYGVSRAQLEAAIAQYDAAVTNAAHDVASQALGASQLAARRREQAAQVAAGERLQATARARLGRGVRDARESLAAQAQLLQRRDDALALHAQALSTELALIKALGGGYRQAPAQIERESGRRPAAGDAPSLSSNASGDTAHERH
jgi:multidrug efflux system outer membrane protein